MNPSLLGAHLSEPDERDWIYVEGQLAAARSIYGSDAAVDWRSIFVRRIQAANDCVAFTTCELVELCSKLHDPTPIPFPSPLFVYSRAVRTMLGGAFEDKGTQFRYALKAAREALVPESDWPETAENVDLVPPADLYPIDGIHAFYRIPNLAECLARGLPPPSAQVDDAMRRGFPVGCVMQVNRPYANLGANVWTGPILDSGPGAWEGYHAQAVVYSGYGRKGLGSSWGADTGDDGVFWVSDDAFDSHLAEFWVVQAAPLDL